MIAEKRHEPGPSMGLERGNRFSEGIFQAHSAQWLTITLLIARAVGGLDKNTGENRRALYDRARAALVSQLRGVHAGTGRNRYHARAVGAGGSDPQGGGGNGQTAARPTIRTMILPSVSARPWPARFPGNRGRGRGSGWCRGRGKTRGSCDLRGNARCSPHRATSPIAMPPSRSGPQSHGSAKTLFTRELRAVRPPPGAYDDEGLYTRPRALLRRHHQMGCRFRDFGRRRRRCLLAAPYDQLDGGELPLAACIEAERRGAAHGRPKIAGPHRTVGQTNPDAANAPAAAVAQKVVLYDEDPNDPQGKRYVGSALWRTETVSPGPGLAPELAVRADIEIPERKLRMTWSLRRNSDKALPASHTIEIMFTLPADFPEGGIGNVPGVLMKQSEQARGVPLAGLAVKVTNGYFLIGLSAVEADQQRNIQLLKERDWFDVPVVYTSGKRAILAMEKGTPGARVFEEAFRAWGQ